MNIRVAVAAVVAGLFMTPMAWAQDAAPSKNEDAAPGKNKEDTYRLLNLFGDVFERVRADYVEAPTDQELIETAISGMLSALDPHSSYLNAKSFRDMQVQTRGAFGGLGIEVTMDRGLVKVVSPIDDTPAFRAGVKPGDYITHLDGEAVLGMTLSDAVEKMRGPVGSDLKITLRREGRDAFDVTLTRAIIKIQSVRSRTEGNIGYVRVTSFSEQSDKGLARAMAKFDAELGKGLRGVVLDLRNNPGGLLDQAVAISDAFLDKGEIVSTRARRNEDTQRFNAREGDLAHGLPMVVLVNGGSASASEIVAGALQDHRRAIIMGTQTFGKGSVQTIIPMAGHGAMRLTTARYFTPSGRSIQGKGIAPDIDVEQSRVESLEKGQVRHEADLRGALSNPDDAANPAEATPAETSAQPPSEDGATPTDAPQDYQLLRALDLLRGIDLYASQTAQ
jgi:carboxyl-terminal processing protease